MIPEMHKIFKATRSEFGTAGIMEVAGCKCKLPACMQLSPFSLVHDINGLKDENKKILQFFFKL